MHRIPALLSILVGALFGVLAWAVFRMRVPPPKGAALGTGDGVLTGLSVLAAFALGVFLTYVFITAG